MIVLNTCLSVVILVESIMAYKLYRAYKRKLLKEELLVQALKEIKLNEEKRHRWISVEEKLPSKYDGLVLIQLSGKPEENITLDNAYKLAVYIREEGWIVEEYPLWETPDVLAGMPLPEPYTEQTKGVRQHETETTEWLSVH